MKSLKKFALLGLVAPLLFSLLSFTNAAVEGKEIIIIKIYERGADEPRIVISTKEKSTRINLEKYKTYAMIEPTEEKNMVTIINTLEQHYKEGYKIESTHSIYRENGGEIVTTYILTK
jgi:hypothetical protein